MLGFATVDYRPNSDTAAVWLTNRASATSASHGNAVTIDLVNDPDARRKVHALTRDRVLLLTDGSTTDGLPLSTRALIVEDLGQLIIETEKVQDEFGDFTQPPVLTSYEPAEDNATQRAFQTANYLARVWSDWLRTDNERRKRTKKKDVRVFEDLPPKFLAQLTPEPLEAFRA